MERKTWTVSIDGTEHSVALNWTYWGGERQVVVDGEVVDDDARLMRWTSAQEFDLGGHRAVVRTEPAKRFSTQFVITLEVDGAVVEPDPGQPSRWERSETAGA